MPASRRPTSVSGWSRDPTLLVVNNTKRSPAACRPVFGSVPRRPRSRWLADVDPAGLKFVTAADDSMEPTIGGGDLLLVDTGVSDVTEAAVYVVEAAGETSVKRCQRRPDGGLYIRSDNKAYQDFEIDPEDLTSLRVVGRVRSVWKAV